LPSLERLHRDLKDRPFSLLAIDVGENKEKVLKFVEARGLSFQFLLDEDSQVSQQYGVRSHPMKFLINKEGNVIGAALGYREWNTEEMKQLIRILSKG
jgi:peroxiredoxin